MRTILPTLILASLLAAGCVDAPEEVTSADTTDDTAQSADAPASGVAQAEPEAANAAPATTREVVPISLEGNTFTALAACPAPGNCVAQGVPSVQGEGTSWFEVDLKGTLREAALTLTWSATTPATEELVLGIAYENDAGESDWITAQGASPLTLDEKTLTIPAEKVNAVYVNAFRCEAAICTSHEQPFTIEGTLTTDAP